MSAAAPSIPAAGSLVATRAFACIAAFVIASAILAGLAPVQMSVAVVFLFAGPHNWIEFRYLLARMPSRWGRSRAYFTLAIAGAVFLTGSYLFLPSVTHSLDLSEAQWSTTVSIWNSAVVAWVVALVRIHGRQIGRDVGWALPLGLLVIAFAWVAPFGWSLGLVYFHPLVALWFLDRELRKRPRVSTAYRAALLLVPVAVAGLVIVLAGSPSVYGDDGVTLRIAQHAGASLLPGVSSRMLIAVHTFLETVHYGAWVIAMPLVGFRSAFWRSASVPLAHRSRTFSVSAQAVLVAGAIGCVVLWFAFSADYATTRDVYFSIAMLHVLAEAPFVVRALGK